MPVRMSLNENDLTRLESLTIRKWSTLEGPNGMEEAKKV